MTGPVIPPQWLTVPLENIILRIVGGGTPSKSKPEYYQGEIPWMSVKDMNKHVLQDTVDHISQEAVDNSSTNIIPAGTPIIATRMSLGKIVIADFDSAINQDLKALFLPAEVHRDYLVYWYRSVARQIEQMGTGTTVKGIRLEALKGLEFTLPPLAEQKVIADKLDTLLAQVENTKARLERIPQILKRFRQSVLTAAVSGRLTEEWRSQNSLTPPRDTWPSCEEITKPFEIPSNWAGVALGSVSERVSVGHVGKTSEFYTDEGSGVPFLRSQNVRPGRISLDGLAYITKPFHQSLKKSQLQPGDLLIVRVGVNRGDACVLPTIFPQVNCANIVFARPKHGLSPYLNLYFQSPLSQELLLGATVGGAQGVINTKSVAQTFLALPPLEEQTEIVRRVDQLFAHADRIEQQVNNALARVNNLTQSILAKAFRGELTEQWRKDNPELISGENSAAAFLERIKVEREVSGRQHRQKMTRRAKKVGKSMAERTTLVEALKNAGKPLTGQQLLTAAGYPSDSNTEQLEQFFLELRDAVAIEQKIVKLERDDDGQDWFTLTEKDDQL